MDTFQTLAEQLKKRAARYHGDLVNLAAESGVSRQWLSLFVNDGAPNPTVKKLDGLNNALLKRERKRARQ